MRLEEKDIDDDYDDDFDNLKKETMSVTKLFSVLSFILVHLLPHSAALVDDDVFAWPQLQ